MNYGDMKSHFNELLNRSDITSALTTRFIDQGIARVQRSLRIPAMEIQMVYDIQGTTTAIIVPNNFIETIDLYHSKGTVLNRISMSRMQQFKQEGKTGTPLYYTREQADFHVYPYPSSGTLTLNYYGEFEPFTSDSTETTMSHIASDLIIYAALTYAATYYLDEREALFEQKFTTLINELQLQADDQEMNGGTQVLGSAYTYED